MRFGALQLISWSMCLTRSSRTNCIEWSADIWLHRLSRVYYIHQDDNRNVQNHTCKRPFLHLRLCVLRLTSWNMCLTDESVEDRLQRIMSGYLCCRDCHEFIRYTRLTIATCKITRVNGPLGSEVKSYSYIHVSFRLLSPIAFSTLLVGCVTHSTRDSVWS